MYRETCLLFISFYLLLAASKPSEDFGKVVFTTILYRHGDRTPINPYPNDPYKNNSLWPAPWGELTDTGKRGQYELGKWLRDRYADLLPKKYLKSDIKIRSTDVDRTLMSAYSNLAGLYEPDQKTNWNPNILWNPIPVHTIPTYMDKVLAGEAPCPKYAEEERKLLESSTFRDLNKKYQKLYEYLSLNTGLNVTNIRQVANVYDNLLIEDIYKLKLPSWTASVYPEPLRQLSGISFSVPCYTRTMAMLKIGPFLNEIVTNMDQKIKGKLPQKALMYSAHDTTVANVLQGLGVFEPHCPPYLSMVLFELRKNSEEEYFVSMHYRNSSTVPPYLLRIPGCDKYCSFQKFKEVLKPLIPDNWKMYYRNSSAIPPYLLNIPGCGSKICPYGKFRFIAMSLVPEDWTEECQDMRFLQNVLDTVASVGFMTALMLASMFFLSLIVVLKYYKNRQWSQSDFAYTILKMDAST